MNGFRELKNSVNQLKDKFYEFKFGLSLISQKRYNYYFNVFMLSSAAVTTGTYFSFHSVPYMMNKWKSTVHMYQSVVFKCLNFEILIVIVLSLDMGKSGQWMKNCIDFHEMYGMNAIKNSTNLRTK